ncbi:FbpB family small basic protein [Aureibacillus halotolerans]|uniref:Fur-regulated basic protein B n=1 Tax=Aureibacillus halotolerans TaxID=1508390 RepID=A0A4R6U576_9BACI|nr:FbpB family small basic protein [Aureibacillus halotolerans]TDQ39749.1 Fur-regulated basic protein B [Aureibacillus halotolerans]
MRRIKRSLNDLISENRESLLKDRLAMEKIESKIDQKHTNRVRTS